MSLLIQKTAVEFVLDNTFLATGQAGQESDTGLIKIGRGNWNDLDYSTPNTNAFEQVLSGLSYKVPSSYAVQQAISGGIGALTLAQVLSNGADANNMSIDNLHSITNVIGTRNNVANFDTIKAWESYFYGFNSANSDYYLLKGTNASLGDPEVQLGIGNTGFDTVFQLLPGRILATGTQAGFDGIVYSADYSANYITRSLIDKGYADATYASASLTLAQVMTNGRNVDATGVIKDSSGNNSVHVNSRSLYYASGIASIQWDDGQLKDPAGVIAVDYENRTFLDVSGNGGGDWENKWLYHDSDITLDWALRTLNLGQWDYDADYSGSYTNRSLVDKEYVLTTIASYVAGLLDYRGTYNASSNLYPSTGGSGVGGAILKGDLWVISVAGILDGTPVEPGDFIIANTDTPGQTGSNWDEIQNNIGFTPENVANKETGSAPTDSTTLYPSSHTVYTALATKENVANKSTDGTLTANSDTLYPSQKAVKTYVDAMTGAFQFDYTYKDGRPTPYIGYEDLMDLVSLTCFDDVAVLAKINSII